MGSRTLQRVRYRTEWGVSDAVLPGGTLDAAVLDMSAFRDPELACPLPDRLWAALVTVIFFVVVALGMAHHEPWRDELQAWMIARDSGSLPELFQNIRYEGHPAGWHLLLFVLSRVTRNPAAMQNLDDVCADSGRASGEPLEHPPLCPHHASGPCVTGRALDAAGAGRTAPVRP
jgi:hypothetical protein